MQNWSGDGVAATGDVAVKYRAIVVDSGPIIKETNVRQWMGKADRFFTVPAVVNEIRDAKARHQLEQQWIPLLGMEVKVPSTQSMHQVAEFSKLTGDYPSLSSVDLQVLALVVDLEREGCCTLEHLRTTPKRTIGLGPITTLHPKEPENTDEGEKCGAPADIQVDYDIAVEDGDSDEEEEDGSSDEGSSDEDADSKQEMETPVVPVRVPPSSWAKLVNPGERSETVQIVVDPVSTIMTPMASVSLDDDAAKRDDYDLARDLELEFPSLAAAATVPYEGEDCKSVPESKEKMITSFIDLKVFNNQKHVRFGLDDDVEARARLLALADTERERRKQEALKPISKSGKLYNSFPKYGNLMKPGPAVLKKTTLKVSAVSTEPTNSAAFDEPTEVPPGQSRILGSGGSALVEGPNMKAEDDDGEGWITSTRHIGVLKSQAGGGPLDPIKIGSAILPDVAASVLKGPLTDQRTACTTTDFAMQNVLLQMGLILLSVDGMQIRRLKSWVLRCGACFKIHTDPFDPMTGMRRMFCAHCGSDRVQRVSASVDGKTGRLKLYFSKRKRNKYMSTRGTKFSLPKPGTGNRFQGDLLLREDQLLMGAWQQKVKKNMGGQSRAHAESIFGQDIASNVGCGVTSMPNEIQVGFGRRNPNAAKGRERRGKKKKSSDRACGLRRY